MELTINTLIKVILVLIVITIIGISLFLLWQNYLEPYFAGLGQEVIGAAILKLKAKKKVLKMREH